MTSWSYKFVTIAHKDLKWKLYGLSQDGTQYNHRMNDLNHEIVFTSTKFHLQLQRSIDTQKIAYFYKTKNL